MAKANKISWDLYADIFERVRKLFRKRRLFPINWQAVAFIGNNLKFRSFSIICQRCPKNYSLPTMPYIL